MSQHISPSEIRGIEFNKTLSGYSKQEVEEFLGLLAQQIEGMEMTIKALQKEIDEKDEKLEHIEEEKDLVKRTLILAEKLKDDTLKSADKEAKNIIKEADISAKERVKKAKDYLSMLEHDYVNLKDKKKSFLLNFKSQITTMLELVQKEIENDYQEERKREKPSFTPSNYTLSDGEKNHDLPTSAGNIEEPSTHPTPQKEKDNNREKYTENTSGKSDIEKPKPTSKIRFQLKPNEED